MASVEQSVTDVCDKGVERIAATSLLLEGRGIIFRGASGSGKSDLALRLILCGRASLVSDDITDISRDQGRLYASAPEELRGLLEVRGLGILRFPPVTSAPVQAVIDLTDSREVERIPKADSCAFLGIPVPRFCLTAFEPSATDKVQLAVRLAVGDIVPVS